MKLSRPKAEETQELNLQIAPQSAVEFAGKREGYFIPLTIEGLKQASLTVEGTLSKTSLEIVIEDEQSLRTIRVGDGIQGEGITKGTKVIDKKENAIAISNPVSVDGKKKLTILPNTDKPFTPTLLGLGIDLVPQGKNIVAKLTCYQFEGTGGEEGNETNASQSIPLRDISIDIDRFLTNARIPRT